MSLNVRAGNASTILTPATVKLIVETVPTKRRNFAVN